MDEALIVCDAPKGIEFFRDFLMQNDYKETTVVDSGEEARRMLVDKDFDLCLINAPLRKDRRAVVDRHCGEKYLSGHFVCQSGIQRGDHGSGGGLRCDHRQQADQQADVLERPKTCQGRTKTYHNGTKRKCKITEKTG